MMLLEHFDLLPGRYRCTEYISVAIRTIHPFRRICLPIDTLRSFLLPRIFSFSLVRRLSSTFRTHPLSTWLNNCGFLYTPGSRRCPDMLVPFRLFFHSVLCSAGSLPLAVSISYSVPQLLFALNRFSSRCHGSVIPPGVESHYVGALRVHSRLRSVTLSRGGRNVAGSSGLEVAVPFRNFAHCPHVAFPGGKLSRFAYTVSRSSTLTSSTYRRRG